jgi:hypothetical protein
MSLFLRNIAPQSCYAKTMYHEINLIFLYFSDTRPFDYEVQIKRKKYLRATLEIMSTLFYSCFINSSNRSGLNQHGRQPQR